MPTPEPEAATREERNARLSLIWEVTRAIIAIAVTLTTLAVAAVQVIQGKADTSAFALLSNTFFLVVGLYFGRSTNHKSGESSRVGVDGA